MKVLLKWEMNNTLKSKAFWGLGIGFIVFNLLLFWTAYSEGGHTGYDMYLNNLNCFNSLLLFLIGVFAGIHVTGAFEERRIQAAIMAGNSRFSVLVAKMLSFSLSVAAFCITAVGISTVTAFILLGTGEMDGSLLVAVLLRGFVYVLVEVSFASICVFISILIKNLGASIAVNLVTLIVLYSLVEALITQEKYYNIFRFTPVGQSIITLIDISPENLITASLVSVFGVLAVLALSYLKFSREELK